MNEIYQLYSIEMLILYKLVVALCILVPAVASDSKISIGNLDVPFLSKLRFETKWAGPTKQCALFLSGIRYKLDLVVPETEKRRVDEKDESTLVGQVDLELLREVYGMLSERDYRFAESNLGNFTENCINILSGSPNHEQDHDDKDAIEPTPNLTEIATTTPTVVNPPVPNDQIVAPVYGPGDIDREDQARRASIKQRVAQEIHRLETELAESRKEVERLRNLMEVNGGKFRNCEADLQVIRESMSQLQSGYETKLRDVQRQANQMNGLAKYERQFCDQQLVARTSERDSALEDNERLKKEMKAFRTQHAQYMGQNWLNQMNQQQQQSKSIKVERIY